MRRRPRTQAGPVPSDGREPTLATSFERDSKTNATVLAAEIPVE